MININVAQVEAAKFYLPELYIKMNAAISKVEVLSDYLKEFVKGAETPEMLNFGDRAFYKGRLEKECNSVLYYICCFSSKLTHNGQPAIIDKHVDFKEKDEVVESVLLFIKQFRKSGD